LTDKQTWAWVRPVEFSLGNRVSGGFSGIIGKDINFKRCGGRVNDTVSNIISDIIIVRFLLGEVSARAKSDTRLGGVPNGVSI